MGGTLTRARENDGIDIFHLWKNSRVVHDIEHGQLHPFCRAQTRVAKFICAALEELLEDSAIAAILGSRLFQWRVALENSNPQWQLHVDEICVARYTDVRVRNSEDGLIVHCSLQRPIGRHLGRHYSRAYFSHGHPRIPLYSSSFNFTSVAPDVSILFLFTFLTS